MSDWRAASMNLPPIRPLGWVLALLRGFVMGLVVYAGLLILLILRLIERPLFGVARPLTPWITQSVCRMSFVIMGLPLTMRGVPMRKKGAVVANHSSWLDIFALNAVQRVYFVSKSEVEGWAAIGWLARATGTVFIARKGTEAKRQQALFETRLRMGHRLLFFPEGTSTDAVRVLPFKSTLFAAFFTHGLDRVLHVQPVTVIYHPPKGQDARYYGWWGEMDFAPSLLRVLSTWRQGRVEVIFHPEVAVDAFAGRKELAAYCEELVRGAHPFPGRQNG